MLLSKFASVRMAAVVSACFCASAQAGNAVLDWNEAMIAAIRKEAISPDLVARNLAILHRAIRGAHDIAAKEEAEEAVNEAGFAAAMTLMPTHSAAFEKVWAQRATGPDGKARNEKTREIGGRAAREVLDACADDGCSVLVSYVPGSKPGQWRRTPPFFRPPELPQFAAKVRPMVLQSPDQFRPAGPPAMEEAAWATALNEVKELGGKESKTRTAEQTEIARFWADFSYTETPPGHWNSIARTIAEDRKLPLGECVRLFDTLNVTLFDTAIACWDAKYFFNLWRPATAIVRAADDGNAATEPDSQWVSLLNTPAHPEYVSGHGAFSAAAATVLAHTLGSDAVTFTVRSDTLRNTTRTFQSLRACAEECGESRVFGGIHYRFSCKDGAEVGRKVAGFVLWTTDLGPVTR